MSLELLKQYGSDCTDSEDEFLGFDLELECNPRMKVSENEGNKGKAGNAGSHSETFNQTASDDEDMDAGPSTRKRTACTDSSDTGSSAGFCFSDDSLSFLEQQSNCSQTDFDEVPEPESTASDCLEASGEHATEDCESDSGKANGEERQLKTPKRKTKKVLTKEANAKKRHSSHSIILDDCTCHRKCNEKFSRDDRLRFHERFWDEDSAGQGNLIRQYAHLKPIERRRDNIKKANLSKRLAYACTLPCASSDPVVVCRKYFLNTIGFRETCG